MVVTQNCSNRTFLWFVQLVAVIGRPRAWGTILRYFFHVAAPGQFYADGEGQDFADPASAMNHGEKIAKELAAESGMNGFWISVVDENGNELGKVPITSPRLTP
jgi:hypothetical protein